METKADSHMPPSKLERLGAIVDRLDLSIQGVVSGDRGFRDTVTVRTEDLMLLVGTVKRHPGILSTMVGITRVKGKG
jgi:hypothetical protein